MGLQMRDNPILQVISNWFKRTFPSPDSVSLFLFLLIFIIAFELFSRILMPIIISIVFAYLLASPVRGLKRLKFPDLLAVAVVYGVFLALFIWALFGLIPLVSRQLINLVQVLPDALNHSQLWANDILERYPRIIEVLQLPNVVSYLQGQVANYGQAVLKYSLATIPGMIEIVLYFVLVPILILFFLKDRQRILDWSKQFLPSHRSLLTQLWFEVNQKIGAYVRGRILEIIIFSTVASITFTFLNLQYALLLGLIVGVATLVPYIGAIVATLPVFIIALMQWGFAPQFTYIVIAYICLTVFDAYILFPLLFAGAMNLHPIIVVISTVFFGSIYGFWGVFFAIPLATLVNAILHVWPRSQSQ